MTLKRISPDEEDHFALYVRECGREILVGDPESGERFTNILNKYFPEADSDIEDDDLVEKYADVQTALNEYIEAWLVRNCGVEKIARRKAAIAAAEPYPDGTRRTAGPFIVPKDE